MNWVYRNYDNWSKFSGSIYTLNWIMALSKYVYIKLIFLKNYWLNSYKSKKIDVKSQKV